MWDLEPLRGLHRVDPGIPGPRGRRPFDVDAVAPVDEQVEVDLTRSPALAGSTAAPALQGLERPQQRQGSRLRVARIALDVDRDSRVPELGLVGLAPGRGRVEARHGLDGDSWKGIQGGDRTGDGRIGVAEVRPETDVGADRRPRAHRAEPYYPPMAPAVDVVILHVDAPADAGGLTRATAAARLDNAERHRNGFLAAGASRADVIAGAPDGRSFGVRLRDLLAEIGGGLVILGSGAIPLATALDRRELVAAAASEVPKALTNNRYSADVIAVSRARSLIKDLPDLQTDNALPRWLEEVAGVPVEDRRTRRRLGIDIDGPLDLVLLGDRWTSALDADDVERVVASLERIGRVTADRGGELVVAGRVSATNLAWLESHTQSRTRALVEERGLRTRRAGQRPAASVLGALLDRDGPGSLGDHLALLADAAIVDTRVLLAHRFGAEGAAWPIAEDRFASDLLLADRINDPWLQELTTSAADARIPVVLGGHTLVGPGLPLALGRPR